MEHSWPEDQEEHVWSEWMAHSGLPKATQYRKCVHPDCPEFQVRDWPQK